MCCVDRTLVGSYGNNPALLSSSIATETHRSVHTLYPQWIGQLIHCVPIGLVLCSYLVPPKYLSFAHTSCTHTCTQQLHTLTLHLSTARCVQLCFLLSIDRIVVNVNDNGRHYSAFLMKPGYTQWTSLYVCSHFLAFC